MRPEGKGSEPDMLSEGAPFHDPNDHLQARTGDRLLRLKEVVEKTSLGSSTIYRRMSMGMFPRPCRLGENCVRWRESEIDEWIANLPAQ